MIELRNIARNFQVGEQTVHALNQINLDIAAGEYLSVMGPSGSGKSTLLNLLGLLDRPDAGTYRLNGIEITEMDEQQQAQTRNRTIGFVFQAFHLIPRLTARENVEIPLLLAGVAAAQRHQQSMQALIKLGLENRADHKPDQLSGGQRQRVAIARATINQPNVLLADEPTGNLDQKSGSDVIKTLESLNDQGITLIVVTHDAELGMRATRQLKMIDGKIDFDSAQNRGNQSQAKQNSPL